MLGRSPVRDVSFIFIASILGLGLTITEVRAAVLGSTPAPALTLAPNLCRVGVCQAPTNPIGLRLSPLQALWVYISSSQTLDANYIINTANSAGYEVILTGTPNVPPYGVTLVDPGTQNAVLYLTGEAVIKAPYSPTLGPQVCSIGISAFPSFSPNYQNVSILTDPNGYASAAPYSTNGAINLDVSAMPGGTSGAFAQSLVAAAAALDADTLGTGAPSFVSDGSGTASVGFYCDSNLDNTTFYAQTVHYGSWGILGGLVANPTAGTPGSNGVKIGINCSVENQGMLNENSAQILYHELGHALGLDHDSTGVMGPYQILGASVDMHLDRDQLDILKLIYSSQVNILAPSAVSCDVLFYTLTPTPPIDPCAGVQCIANSRPVPDGSGSCSCQCTNNAGDCPAGDYYNPAFCSCDLDVQAPTCNGSQADCPDGSTFNPTECMCEQTSQQICYTTCDWSTQTLDANCNCVTIGGAGDGAGDGAGNTDCNDPYAWECGY